MIAPMKRQICAVILCRFSPRPDQHDSESNETQERICRTHCEKRGYRVVAVIHEDAVSGGDAVRKQTWEAIGKLKRGYALVVDKMDRLARDVLMMELFHREVKARKAFIESVAEGIQGQDADSDAMRQVRSVMDEKARKDNAARTSRYMLMHQSCNLLMTSRPPIGKKLGPLVTVVRDGEKVQRRSIVDNPDEQASAAEVVRIKAENPDWGCRRIALELEQRQIKPRGKKWHASTVYNILKKATV